jgi:hypothetical protein
MPHPYRDAKPVVLVEHLSLLAEVRHTPFVVMPRASRQLARVFGMGRMAAMGLRRPELMAGG